MFRHVIKRTCQSTRGTHHIKDSLLQMGTKVQISKRTLTPKWNATWKDRHTPFIIIQYLVCFIVVLHLAHGRFYKLHIKDVWQNNSPSSTWAPNADEYTQRWFDFVIRWKDKNLLRCQWSAMSSCCYDQ